MRHVRDRRSRGSPSKRSPAGRRQRGGGVGRGCGPWLWHHGADRRAAGSAPALVPRHIPAAADRSTRVRHHRPHRAGHDRRSRVRSRQSGDVPGVGVHRDEPRPVENRLYVVAPDDLERQELAPADRNLPTAREALLRGLSTSRAHTVALDTWPRPRGARRVIGDPQVAGSATLSNRRPTRRLSRRTQHTPTQLTNWIGSSESYGRSNSVGGGSSDRHLRSFVRGSGRGTAPK